MDSIPNTLIPFPEIRRKNKGVPEKQKKKKKRKKEKGVLTRIIVTLLSCVLFVHSNFALGFGVHIFFFFFYFRYLFSPLPVHCLLLHIYGILSWRRRFILSSFLMHIF